MPPTAPVPAPLDDESKKKYIRTYAGDMEILKKSGTPDLKPYTPPTPPPATKAPEPPPPPPPPPVQPVPPPPAPPIVEAPPPPPPPAPLPPPPPPPPRPAPPPPPKPIPPPAPRLARVVPPEIKISPLKTYTDDFLQKVKDTHASTASVLAAEEDARTGEVVAPHARTRWSTLTVVVGIVLLLFGVVGLYVGYTRYLTNNAPIVLAPTVSAPIFVDEKEKIMGDTGPAMLQAIEQSMTRTLAPNSVRLLYTDIATTTGNSVFSALDLPAPDVLLRNINAQQSMAGIVNIDGTPSPFFILSVDSYPDTFAGMLSWEATMPSDMSGLFPPYEAAISPTVATTTPAVATTTPKTTVKTKTKTKVATSTPPAPPAPVPAFYDEVVSNHDVRVYRDSQGRSVLIYGYWDKNTLVIARDPASFTEILRRLATSNTQ